MLPSRGPGPNALREEAEGAQEPEHGVASGRIELRASVMECASLLALCGDAGQPSLGFLLKPLPADSFTRWRQGRLAPLRRGRERKSSRGYRDG